MDHRRNSRAAGWHLWAVVTLAATLATALPVVAGAQAPTAYTVHWTPPATDANGVPVDPASLRYEVYVGARGQEKLVGDGIEVKNGRLAISFPAGQCIYLVAVDAAGRQSPPTNEVCMTGAPRKPALTAR